jgi:O-antigen ligase
MAQVPVTRPELDRARRLSATALLSGLAAVSFGAMLPRYPAQALALVVLVPLGLWAPAVSLATILFVTVLVPFDVQNELAVVGGRDVPGLLVIDVLLVLGLCRVTVLGLSGRLEPNGPVLLAAALGLLLAVALMGGVVRGAAVSEAGHEARRVVLGVGAVILAWPILEDEAARRRLYKALLALGLLLGAWGLAQWLLAIDYTSGADVGVRPGVDETSAGRGQLQGGLYVYPVAVILSFAALLSTRSGWAPPRRLIATIFGLNLVCLLLTYERTFWAATVLGCLIVVLRSGRESWRSALKWAAIAAAGLFLILALLAPSELRTAAERLASVVQYRSDRALAYRQVEARAVLGAIRQDPLTGSGFGATITWGKKNTFGTITTPFVHNGYLWLAWKIGIPLTLLVVLAVGMVAARRAPPTDDPVLATLRVGSQAALAALLLINITFPAFNALGITAVMGLLIAVCLWPRPSG